MCAGPPLDRRRRELPSQARRARLRLCATLGARRRATPCIVRVLCAHVPAQPPPPPRPLFPAALPPADASRLSAAPCGGVLVLAQHLVLYYRQGQQAGVVLHPSALPPRAPPPQLNLFDARAMQAAGGPGPAAALYARDHAMDVYPVRGRGGLEAGEGGGGVECVCGCVGGVGCGWGVGGAAVCWKGGAKMGKSC